MKTLRVSECFYSVQGEGARAGEPSVFIRLAGCNLECGFCDTEFQSSQELDLEAVVCMAYASMRRVMGWTGRLSPGWVVWTGGEPTLQLDQEVVAYFKANGWKQALETNGSKPAPPGLDWVAVSPKVAEHVLAKNFPDGVDELRYVRHAGQPGVPEPQVKAKRRFLSPMFSGDRPDPENLRHCVALCLANPDWTLSVQLHKLLKVL